MKPEQLFLEIKAVAEKLGVIVSEQSFRGSRLPVKSGFCVIKGKMHCIIDKNISLTQKTSVLARAIAHLPLDTLYIVPAVRDAIATYGHDERPRFAKPAKV